MLNHSIFGYLEQCRLINELLCEYGFLFTVLRETEQV